MLKVENINVYYGAIHAIQGISFEVHQGEIVTLIGANGAGKSTTLKTVSGQLRTRTGSITFMNENISRLDPYKIARKGLVQVPEGRKIFQKLSVEENLFIGGYTRERAEIDPMLTPEYIEAVRLAYAAGQNYRSSDLSPLFADFEGFPPTLIQVGDHEILYSDSESLYQAMKRANVPCRLQVSEGMWHVFQMFPMKKASIAMDNVARFLLEQ